MDVKKQKQDKGGFAMRPFAALCFAFMLLAALGTEGIAGSIAWLTLRHQAIVVATEQHKKIILVAGRDTCPNTNHMRFTVFETLSPPVKELVKQHYIAWYANMDYSSEWKNYASDLGGFTLPMICVIDPAGGGTCLDRSTNIQSADQLYARLQSFVKQPEQPPVPPQTPKSFLLLSVPSLITR